MASLESSRLDGQTGDVETEVPKSARWLYCGEPDDRQKAVLGKDCGTRADFRVALPSPPAHYLELAQSPRYPAILPFLGHARTLLRTLPRSLIHPFHPPWSRVPSLFCQLMTFPQSFCDNFCPEATPPPHLPLYYWTRTSFNPPKSRTEAPLPSPRVPRHNAVLPPLHPTGPVLTSFLGYIYSSVLQREAAESRQHALHLVQQQRRCKPEAEESADPGKCRVQVV